jgi:iron uptake system component EfeO
MIERLHLRLALAPFIATLGLSPVGIGIAVAQTPAAAPAATAAPATTPVDLSAPISEYKTYVVSEVNALVAETTKFVAAIKAGHLAEAQRLYAPAHRHYERIEPIAELFNDLDSSMDARADDFEKKEQDPTWTGFHRLEKILFADKTTKGAGPLADKLLADSKDLQQRLASLTITPKAMVGGAADLIEEVASKKITGEEDRYSRTDLWDFQANIDGAQKIVSLLRPQIQPRDPKLLGQLDTNFRRVDAILVKYRQGDGFKNYEMLSAADRNQLKGPITALAEDLSRLRGILGIEE